MYTPLFPVLNASSFEAWLATVSSISVSGPLRLLLKYLIAMVGVLHLLARVLSKASRTARI